MDTEEKLDGGVKTMFVARLKLDGRLELRVRHNNQAERQTIQRHANDPVFFAVHEGLYARSSIRAKYWMARVVSDFRQQFIQNRVDFVIVGTAS